MTWLLIGLAGAAGALTRLGVSRYAGRRFGSALPWGTMAVNLMGAFLLGLLTGLMLGRGAISPVLKAVLGTGFLGAFTTFSTWQVEIFWLRRNGTPGLAWAHLLVSTGAGLLLAWTGVLVGWWL